MDSNRGRAEIINKKYKLLFEIIIKINSKFYKFSIFLQEK
jgi:hypothetical protein